MFKDQPQSPSELTEDQREDYAAAHALYDEFNARIRELMEARVMHKSPDRRGDPLVQLAAVSMLAGHLLGSAPPEIRKGVTAAFLTDSLRFSKLISDEVEGTNKLAELTRNASRGLGRLQRHLVN